MYANTDAICDIIYSRFLIYVVAMLSESCGLTFQFTNTTIRGFVDCVAISDGSGLTGAVEMSSLENTISISSLYIRTT